MLNKNSYDPSKPNQLLGLDWGNRAHTAITAKYYIGLSWLKEGESAIYIEPKIEDLDFLSMFMNCFDNECQDVVHKLVNTYEIAFSKKPIKLD